MLEAGVPILVGGGGGKGQREWLQTASRRTKDRKDGVRGWPGGVVMLCVPMPRAAPVQSDSR